MKKIMIWIATSLLTYCSANADMLLPWQPRSYPNDSLNIMSYEHENSTVLLDYMEYIILFIGVLLLVSFIFYKKRKGESGS